MSILIGDIRRKLSALTWTRSSRTRPPRRCACSTANAIMGALAVGATAVGVYVMCVFVYMEGFTIQEKGVGHVVAHVGVPRTRSARAFPGRGRLVETVQPSLENGAVFVATQLYITSPQTNGTCSNEPAVPSPPTASATRRSRRATSTMCGLLGQDAGPASARRRPHPPRAVPPPRPARLLPGDAVVPGLSPNSDSTQLQRLVGREVVPREPPRERDLHLRSSEACSRVPCTGTRTRPRRCRPRGARG